MATKTKRVLIAAGGTGGHVFPAIAVAEQLASQGYDVVWLGARYGMEAEWVSGKFPITLMSMRGIRGNGLLAKLLMPWRGIRSLIKACWIIRKLKPNVVLAMGGYVAAPAGMAAWLNRVPLVIHEQNAKAGLTNRFLTRFACVSLEGFAGALSGKKVIHTGNPVRKAFLEVPLPEYRYELTKKELKILVVGGSQGARAINQCVVQAWQEREKLNNIYVWHQTGALDYQDMKQAYSTLPIESSVEAFIDDLAAGYRWADLVICRAGALTISEIAAVGVASILIPYPYATDDHQTFNARNLTDCAAGILLKEENLTSEAINQILSSALENKHDLVTMARHAKALSMSGATEKVASQCVAFLKD